MMQQNWHANLAAVLATTVAVVLCVLVHYEGLMGLTKALGTRARHQRVNVLYAILSLLVLHVVEIWIFGFTLWGLLQWPGSGSLSGTSPNFLDAVYFSAVTFTTVGYGDMIPVGAVRFLAGSESLVGLLLITWSASFTYLEMARFWRNK